MIQPHDLSSHKLIIEVEVPDFWVDEGTQEYADEFLDGEVLPVVIQEWMSSDVGLTFVSPSRRVVHAMNARIVGARIVPREGKQ